MSTKTRSKTTAEKWADVSRKTINQHLDRVTAAWLKYYAKRRTQTKEKP